MALQFGQLFYEDLRGVCIALPIISSQTEQMEYSIDDCSTRGSEVVVECCQLLLKEKRTERTP